MPKQLVSVLVATCSLWRCVVASGQVAAPVSPPKVIENPYYRANSTAESSPTGTEPARPVTLPREFPSSIVGQPTTPAPQTIENPGVSAARPEPQRPPSPANPFISIEGERPLLRPLRWGPANRWRRPDPPAPTSVQVFAPRELRPVDPAPELQILDDPLVLEPTDNIDATAAASESEPPTHDFSVQLPEAVAAMPPGGEPPDPSVYPDTTVVQPTWLDAVDEQPDDDAVATDTDPDSENDEEASEATTDEVVPEDLVITEPNSRPNIFWVVPRNDTYDPFDDEQSIAIAQDSPASDAEPQDASMDEAAPQEGPILGSAKGLDEDELDSQSDHVTDAVSVPDEQLDVTSFDDASGPISLDLEPQLRDVASPLAQAQLLAQDADTRETLSRVIHLTRQAMASDITGAQLKKARELAAWAHNRRGELLDEAGDGQAALDDFQAAVQLDGKCWLALHNRAIALAERYQYDRALSDFTAVIDLNPGWTMAYRNRGELLASLGRSQEACEDYSMALAQQPANAELYALRGDAWLRMREYPRALNDYTTSIQLNPDNPHALTGRGSVFGEVGQYEQAIANYRHALRADPTYVEALRSLAWLLATCPNETYRNGEEALAAAKQAARFAPPNDPFVLEALAAAYARLGRFDHAVQCQQRAVSAAPTELAKTAEFRLDLYLQGQPYLSGRPTVVQATYDN